MISLQSDKPNEYVDDGDESLQTFSKTCSVMFGKISKKQYEYSSCEIIEIWSESLKCMRHIS